MIAVDTNVLVRYFTGDDPVQATAATAFVDSLTEERRGFVCLTVMAELYWVLRGVRALGAPAALDAIDRLLDAVEIEVEDEESVYEAVQLARGGADFADALIAETSRLYGISETVTFDRRASGRLGWRLLS